MGVAPTPLPDVRRPRLARKTAVMGWAYGRNAERREVGYSVEATCDASDCEVDIDRGLAYCCGGMHDGDEHGCGGYFCLSHLLYACPPPNEPVPQLCGPCLDRYQVEHPDDDR